MSLLDEVVTRCTEIEQLLRRRGGTGSGIAELLDSLRGDIARDVASRVRELAQVRNRFVHEHGYVYPGMPASLISDADTILAELRSRIQGFGSFDKTSVPDQHKASSEHMTNSIPWVTLTRKSSQRGFATLRIPSSDSVRLVFFKASFPIVKDIGLHQIPFFGVEAIAQVGMMPAIINFTISTFTLEPIEMVLNVDITARVNPKNDAIARIASDAYSEKNSEIRLLESALARNLQSLVSETPFENLPDIKSLQSQLLPLLVQVDSTNHALIVDSIAIRSFAPVNPEVRTHKLDHLVLHRRAALKLVEDAEDFRRREIERKDRELETAQKRKDIEWERELSRQTKLDDEEFRVKEHERQRELKEMDNDTKVRIEELRIKAEVSRMIRDDLVKFIPHLIEAGIMKGKMELSAELINKLFGVSLSTFDHPNIGSANSEPAKSNSVDPNDPQSDNGVPPKAGNESD